MEQVVIELEKLNKKADVIIGIMQTPENKFLKLMEIVGITYFYAASSGDVN